MYEKESEIDLQQDEGLFDDLIPKKTLKGVWYHVLTLSSTLFIIVVFADLFIDLKRLRIQYFDWQMAITFLLLPLLALVFHLASKKIGWIIGYFYYTGFSMLGLFSILKQLNEIKRQDPPAMDGIAILFLIAVNMMLLLLPSIRNYFRISNLALIITSVVAIAIGLLLFISL